MKNDKQSWILSNIVSPYGLAMISYALFLFACLIPPSVYTHYMNEPDLMFLDPATILFYSLCVASYVAGVWLISWISPSEFKETILTTRISPTLFILAPLGCAIAATVLSMTILIKQAPYIFALLFAQQGGDLKDALATDVEGNYAFVPLLLIGVTWWAFSRHSSVGLYGWRKRLIRLFLLVALTCVVVSSILTLIRSLLMLIFCGLAILYLVHRTAKRQVSSALVFGGGLSITLCVVVSFFALSFMRGTDNWDDQFTSLFGYTVASYNRLAAIVNGNLRYPYGGHGIYLSNVISHTHRLPFMRIVNPPDAIEVWGSEFGAVSQAGLDGSLIWSGTFGYIFSDLGWFSLPFVFGYGILHGFVWRWVRRGSVFGVVMYPFFGFCVLFWLGTNYLMDTPMEFMLLPAILLTVYEFVFVRKLEDGASGEGSIA